MVNIMELYGLTKDKIKKHSQLVGDFYVFMLGDKFMVTMRKKDNNNKFLTKYANRNSTIDDKIVIRYFPSNSILFSKELIDDMSDTDIELMLHISMDVTDNYIYIGRYEKYPIKTGLLVMSGVLSANNLVEKNINIYFTGQNTKDILQNKIKLLSVGLLNNDFYGIIYLPKERGLVVQDTENDYKYFSVKTWNKRKSFNVDKYERFNIDDCFSSRSTKIEVLEDKVYAQ